MIELVVLSRAESELQRIYNRLEDFQSGRGEEFLRRLDLALAHLQQFPEIGPVYFETYRRLLLGQLPFGLFYSVEGNYLIIITAASLQQDPASWTILRDSGHLYSRISWGALVTNAV